MFVLDTNVAIAIAIGDKRGEFYKEAVQNEDRVISSEFMLAESIHVIRKYVLRDEIEVGDADKWLTTIKSLVDDFYPVKADIREALHESIRLNHSPYDLFFFILARRFGACMLSFDQALVDLCFKEGLSTCTDIPFPA